jgi:hypothetical protein
MTPAHQLLIKLCSRAGDEAAVGKNVDAFIEPLEKTLNKKIKDGAAITDVDKIMDLIRSAMRVVLALDRLTGADTKGWGDFMGRNDANERLATIMTELREEGK